MPAAVRWNSWRVQVHILVWKMKLIGSFFVARLAVLCTMFWYFVGEIQCEPTSALKPDSKLAWRIIKSKH